MSAQNHQIDSQQRPERWRHQQHDGDPQIDCGLIDSRAARDLGRRIRLIHVRLRGKSEWKSQIGV